MILRKAPFSSSLTGAVKIIFLIPAFLIIFTGFNASFLSISFDSFQIFSAVSAEISSSTPKFLLKSK